jgi:hypothetical protein
VRPRILSLELGAKGADRGAAGPSAMQVASVESRRRIALMALALKATT